MSAIPGFSASSNGPICKATPDLTAAFPANQGAEVLVGLRNGKTIHQRLDNVIAATPEEIRARFRQAAADVIGDKRARHLEELVDNCASLPDSQRHRRPVPARAGRTTAAASVMIDNDKQKMGGTMFKPETAETAIPIAGPKHGYSLPARGLR